MTLRRPSRSTPAPRPRSDARLDVDDRGGLRILTLHNPARKNALDETLLDALARAVDPQSNGHVRAFLIRGAGGVFCSGYDLSALPAAADEGRLPDDRLGEVLAMLRAHPAPSIALVEGFAFGAGCELACTCDFRVGSAQTVFCMPPAKLGIVYAPEGLAKVAAIVGLPRAKRMFFTGMRVDGATAYAWGLLDEVVDSKELEQVAQELAQEIAQNAPGAVAGMKRAFNLLTQTRLDPSEVQELRGLRREAFRSEDAKEGKAAFAEKRKPDFKGR